MTTQTSATAIDTIDNPEGNYAYQLVSRFDMPKGVYRLDSDPCYLDWLHLMQEKYGNKIEWKGSIHTFMECWVLIKTSEPIIPIPATVEDYTLGDISGLSDRNIECLIEQIQLSVKSHHANYRTIQRTCRRIFELSPTYKPRLNLPMGELVDYCDTAIALLREELHNRSERERGFNYASALDISTELSICTGVYMACRDNDASENDIRIAIATALSSYFSIPANATDPYSQGVKQRIADIIYSYMLMQESRTA